MYLTWQATLLFLAVMLVAMPVMLFFKRRGATQGQVATALLLISIALVVGGFGVASLENTFTTFRYDTDGLPLRVYPSFPFQKTGLAMIVIGFLLFVAWIQMRRR